MLMRCMSLGSINEEVGYFEVLLETARKSLLTKDLVKVGHYGSAASEQRQTWLAVETHHWGRCERYLIYTWLPLVCQWTFSTPGTSTVMLTLPSLCATVIWKNASAMLLVCAWGHTYRLREEPVEHEVHEAVFLELQERWYRNVWVECRLRSDRRNVVGHLSFPYDWACNFNLERRGNSYWGYVPEVSSNMMSKLTWPLMSTSSLIQGSLALAFEGWERSEKMYFTPKKFAHCCNHPSCVVIYGN